MADPLSSFRDFVYIVNGTNFATATEGAQKLKEVAYINASSCIAGELRHGSIAMIDENIAIVSILIPNQITYEKMLLSCADVKARNSTHIALTSSDDEQLNELCDYLIKIPKISEFLSPLIVCIPLQLLTYYIADFLGKDVDQPRNLEKSVSVEKEMQEIKIITEYK